MTFPSLLCASAGGFNWYGFLIGSGMVICIIICYFNAKKRGYYPDAVFDIAICTIPCAIVGARLYYVIFDKIAHPEVDWSFRKIIGLDGGLAGLAIYGGLIGACLGALIVLLIRRKKPAYDKITFMQMADLCFPTIFLGQAIGRWGNFVNQEAYGGLVTNPSLQWFPYAVHIDAVNSVTGQAAWFQATFFYESMWNLAGCALLLWFYMGRRKSFDGFVFGCYCIWYGVGRFFIEGLRTDSLWLVPNVIRVSQLVSAIIFIFGVAWLVAHVYRARLRGKKPFIFVPESALCADYLDYEKSIFYLRTLRPAPEEEPEEDDEDDIPPEDRYWEQPPVEEPEEDITEKYFGRDYEGGEGENIRGDDEFEGIGERDDEDEIPPPAGDVAIEKKSAEKNKRSEKKKDDSAALTRQEDDDDGEGEESPYVKGDDD